MQTQDVPTTRQDHSSLEDELMLMRFPPSVRTQIDQLEAEEVERKTSPPPRYTGSSKTYQAPKPPKWKRRFILLMMFLFTLGGYALWALESDHWKQRSIRQLDSIVNKQATALTHLPRGKTLRSLAAYTKHYERILSALTNAKRLYCTMDRPTPLSKDLPAWRRYLTKTHQFSQTWIRSTFRTQYKDLRAKVLQTPSRPRSRTKESCTQLPRLIGLLKKQLYNNSKSLHANAKLHLRWYGWCKMVWTRAQFDPEKRKQLQSLRQRKCRQACKTSTAACRQCRTLWRQELQISEEQFDYFRRFVQKERKRKCLYWTKQKPAGEGVFHLGEYYWRIRRSLRYMDLLARYKQCGRRCQRLRRAWGFQLDVKSAPEQSNLYIQLWPKHLPTPTSLMRALEVQPQGETNDGPIWLPALRTDLLDTPPPRSMWYLFYLKDKAPGSNALLPLAPKPGQYVKKHVQLASFQMHTDGRQQTRHLSLSQDGSFLSFVTFDLLDWESMPDVGKSYCTLHRAGDRERPKKQTIVSIYPLDRSGQPYSKGHHLPLTDWPQHVQLEGSPAKRALLLTTRTPPPKSPQDTRTLPAIRDAGAALWRIPLSLTQRDIFDLPTLIQANRAPHRMIIPIQSQSASSQSVELACPLPDQKWFLHSIPPDPLIKKRWALPNGGALHDIVQHTFGRQQALVFLTQEGKQTWLRVYSKRGHHLKTLDKQLPSRYRQLRSTSQGLLVSAGPWGAPLRLLRARQWQTWMPGHPQVRYLDPVYHTESKRLFVIKQWKFAHSSSWTSTKTFLISRSLAGTLKR